MDIDTALDAFYHSKHKERVNKVYEPKPEPIEPSQYELEINDEIENYLNLTK